MNTEYSYSLLTPEQNLNSTRITLMLIYQFSNILGEITKKPIPLTPFPYYLLREGGVSGREGVRLVNNLYQTGRKVD